MMSLRQYRWSVTPFTVSGITASSQENKPLKMFNLF
jgi:hypothetical protein